VTYFEFGTPNNSDYSTNRTIAALYGPAPQTTARSGRCTSLASAPQGSCLSLIAFNASELASSLNICLQAVANNSAAAASSAAPPPVDQKPAMDVVAGATARAASQATIHPIDTMKVRMQAGDMGRSGENAALLHYSFDRCLRLDSQRTVRGSRKAANGRERARGVGKGRAGRDNADAPLIYRLQGGIKGRKCLGLQGRRLEARRWRLESSRGWSSSGACTRCVASSDLRSDASGGGVEDPTVG
jgi:hypothetical protein